MVWWWVVFAEVKDQQGLINIATIDSYAGKSGDRDKPRLHTFINKYHNFCLRLSGYVINTTMPPTTARLPS